MSQHSLSSWMGEGLTLAWHRLYTVWRRYGWGILSMSLNLPNVTELQQFTLTNFSHLIALLNLSSFDEGTTTTQDCSWGLLRSSAVIYFFDPQGSFSFSYPPSSIYDIPQLIGCFSSFINAGTSDASRVVHHISNPTIMGTPQLLKKPNGTTAEASAEAQKTSRAKAPLQGEKVVIRRLPPGLTESEFLTILGDEWKLGAGKVGWFSYWPGKVSQQSVLILPFLDTCFF